MPFGRRWKKLEWDRESVEAMKMMDYAVKEMERKSVVQLIHRSITPLASGLYHTRITGVSDPRKAGWPDGY